MDNNFFHKVFWDYIINGLEELSGEFVKFEDLPLKLYGTQKGRDFFALRNSSMGTEFITSNYYIIDTGLKFLINDVKVGVGDIILFDDTNRTIKAMICGELKIIVNSPLNMRYRNKEFKLDKRGIKELKSI